MFCGRVCEPHVSFALRGATAGRPFAFGKPGKDCPHPLPPPRGEGEIEPVLRTGTDHGTSPLEPHFVASPLSPLAVHAAKIVNFCPANGGAM